jgi:hypothetical protein
VDLCRALSQRFRRRRVTRLRSPEVSDTLAKLLDVQNRRPDHCGGNHEEIEDRNARAGGDEAAEAEAGQASFADGDPWTVSSGLESSISF